MYEVYDDFVEKTDKDLAARYGECYAITPMLSAIFRDITFAFCDKFGVQSVRCISIFANHVIHKNEPCYRSWASELSSIRRFRNQWLNRSTLAEAKHTA